MRLHKLYSTYYPRLCNPIPQTGFVYMTPDPSSWQGLQIQIQIAADLQLPRKKQYIGYILYQLLTNSNRTLSANNNRSHALTARHHNQYLSCTSFTSSSSSLNRLSSIRAADTVPSYIASKNHVGLPIAWSCAAHNHPTHSIDGPLAYRGNGTSAEQSSGFTERARTVTVDIVGRTGGTLVLQREVHVTSVRNASRRWEEEWMTSI